jgi:cytochrome c oxidase subunit 2
MRDLRTRQALVAGALAGALLGGCARAPSTLDPRGPRAAQAAEIWWVMLVAATLVFLVVMGALLYALFRRRPVSGRGDAETRRRGERMPGQGFVVAGGVGLPIVILVPLSVYWLVSTAALARPTLEPDFAVEVVGYQFWWEVRYPDHSFVTANEIRVPVGRPVEVRLTSVDVIHSFWVPQLMGKLDLIPGRTNTTWLQADQAGIYFGECAEYCGVQHAKMAFMVVAEPPEQLAAWLERQKQPAAEPADPTIRRGAQVFARAGCIECHTVRFGDGSVGGKTGPDLTHFGSRLTVGAGILENNRDNLAGWIANPQAIKPGNKMPVADLDAESLMAVVAYLESLK